MCLNVELDFPPLLRGAGVPINKVSSEQLLMKVLVGEDVSRGALMRA